MLKQVDVRLVMYMRKCVVENGVFNKKKWKTYPTLDGFQKKFSTYICSN